MYLLSLNVTGLYGSMQSGSSGRRTHVRLLSSSFILLQPHCSLCSSVTSSVLLHIQIFVCLFFFPLAEPFFFKESRWLAFSAPLARSHFTHATFSKTLSLTSVSKNEQFYLCPFLLSFFPLFFFLFSIVYPCLLCHRLVNHRYVGLSLGFLSCSIDLYFCFCASTILS